MFYRFLKVVLHRPIGQSAIPSYNDEAECISMTHAVFDVDLVRRTVSIPEGTSGEFDLDSAIRLADTLRMACNCYRDGILELPPEYKPTSAAVLRWLYKYVVNVIGGVDRV